MIFADVFSCDVQIVVGLTETPGPQLNTLASHTTYPIIQWQLALKFTGHISAPRRINPNFSEPTLKWKLQPLEVTRGS